MLTLTAAQHFYSSVPAAQSPVNRRGYQTVAATPGLPADAVAAIEDRSQYATAAGDPLKWQFYALPGGYLAMSQLAPLAEPDEFGRKGRYLGHTLIVDAATFARLDCCPLDVLMQHPFATSLDEVFRQAGPGKGQVPVARVSVEPQWRAAAIAYARRWNASSLTALGRLAWRAGELTAAGDGVALIGSDRDQFALLGLLFLLAAPDRRRLLSFDTRVEGCDFGRDVVFWGRGYATAPAAPLRYLLDPAAGRFVTDLPHAADGPYASWMARDALPNGIDTVAAEQGWAAAVEHVLRTGQPAPTWLGAERVPDAFLDRFARLNPEAAAQPWLAQLPAGLSPEFQRALLTDLATRPGRALARALDGIDIQEVWDFVCRFLFDRCAVPSPADRKALEPWLRATAQPTLLTLPPFWAGDEKAWLDSLAPLDDDEYGAVMAALAAWPAPPIPLRKALPAAERGGSRLPFLKGAKLPGLGRGHEPAPAAPATDAAAVRRVVLWVENAGRSVNGGDWPKVLDALAEVGEPALDAVARIAPRLPYDAQHAIARWLKGYRGEAAALRAAVKM